MFEAHSKPYSFRISEPSEQIDGKHCPVVARFFSGIDLCRRIKM